MAEGKRFTVPYYLGMALLVLALGTAACFYYRSIGGFCPNVVSDRLLQEQVKKLWQEGRVVVLMRHTDKCVDDDPCPGGQGLTRKGEQDAKIIGEGMRTLFNNDFELFSSVVARAEATARLAFGRTPTVVPWLREDCKQDMQTRLLKPRRGNQVMVTHSTCLGVLRNDQGEKLIPFKPAGREDYGLAVFLERVPGGGMPRILGFAWPDDWSNLLND